MRSICLWLSVQPSRRSRTIIPRPTPLIQQTSGKIEQPAGVRLAGITASMTLPAISHFAADVTAFLSSHQDLDIQDLFSNEPFEAGVFLLQSLPSLCLADIHAAEFGFSAELPWNRLCSCGTSTTGMPDSTCLGIQMICSSMRCFLVFEFSFVDFPTENSHSKPSGLTGSDQETAPPERDISASSRLHERKTGDRSSGYPPMPLL
ncbi:MAG: hypothetical protein PWQ29_442 [Verrucomicrobiota bacterium]|nr:hypothetical protein [Verrucomicrobiota bacterium]MDK2963048.1 hypothetical protein [Verrucomicrobiota bacterium]